MFSQITDLMEGFKNHLPPKKNVSNRINNFLETNSSSASQKISFETRQRIEQIEKRKAYLKQFQPIPSSTIRGECAPIGDLVPKLKEKDLDFSQALKKLDQIPSTFIEKEKTKVESKKKKENERQETSFEKLKEKHKAEKLQIVPSLQRTKGLQTKECRKAIILCLLNDYNQMEKKVCFASNDKLLTRLKEFCFEINERTLKRDLKELKEQGLIEIKIDKYQNEYYQVRTSRSIKTKESINTFCPTEDQMDFNRNKFKNIFIEISNKFLRAKKSLQENYERIKKYYELRKQEKRNKSKPINVHEVVEYFISELRKPASKAIDFFNWYSKRGWLDSGGKQINSWQGIAKVWG